MNKVAPEFNIVVPFDHKIISKDTGKRNLMLTTIFFVFALVYIMFLIYAIKIKLTISIVFFLAFTVINLALGVIFLIQTLKKSTNEVLKYQFYKPECVIFKENLANHKSKVVCSFLYFENKGKKHLFRTIETALAFELHLYCGEINGYPQFKKYVIPKDVFKTSEDMLAFKSFLNSKVEFIVK